MVTSSFQVVDRCRSSPVFMHGKGLALGKADLRRLLYWNVTAFNRGAAAVFLY